MYQAFYAAWVVTDSQSVDMCGEYRLYWMFLIIILCVTSYLPELQANQMCNITNIASVSAKSDELS